MKKKYKAPKWFINLFHEGITINKEIVKYITSIVGYGEDWCRQNEQKVNEMLDIKQKDKVNGMMDKAETIKKYAWSRYFYENWDEVKDLISSPLSTSSFNDKKKLIIISEPSIVKKAIANASEKIARKVAIAKLKKELKGKV